MKSEHNKFGYMGVREVRHAKSELYVAKLRVKGKIYKKYAKTPEEAGALYDEMLKEHAPERLEEKEKPESKRTNQHGALGIRYKKDKGIWQARIRRGGKSITRNYKTKEEAITGVEKLKEEYPTLYSKKPKENRKKAEKKQPIYTKEELYERTKSTRRKAYKENREEILAKLAEDRKTNPEKYRERSRKWYANNPEAREKALIYATIRKINKLRATPKWEKRPEGIYEELRKIAKALEKLTGIEYHVDHVVPLAAGVNIEGEYMQLACGLHCEDNLQLLEAYENASKSCYYWPDMWQYTEEDLIETRGLLDERTEEPCSGLADAA